DLLADDGDDATHHGCSHIVVMTLLAARVSDRILGAAEGRGGDPGCGAAAQSDAEGDVVRDPASERQHGQRVGIDGEEVASLAFELPFWPVLLFGFDLQPEVDGHGDDVEAWPEVGDGGGYANSHSGLMSRTERRR